MKSDADFDRFTTVMVTASEVYSRVVSEAMAAIYWQTLSPYSIEMVETAFQRHVADPEAGQFFPKPADFIRQMSGTRTDQAQIAWGKVMQAVRIVGAYRDVVFDDALIHLAIEDQGGWPQICRTKIDDLSYAQHKFCEAYRAYVANTPIDYPAVLIGEAGAWNRLHGHAVADPVLIGNADVARLVMSAGSGGSAQITDSAADIARRALEKTLRPQKDSPAPLTKSLAQAARAAQLRYFKTEE